MKRWVFEYLQDLYERGFGKNAMKWAREVKNLLKEAFEEIGFKVVFEGEFLRAVRQEERYLLLVKVTAEKPTVILSSEEIRKLKKLAEVETKYNVGIACLELRATSFWKIGKPKFSWLKPGPFNPDYELKVRWKELEDEVNMAFELVVSDYL